MINNSPGGCGNDFALDDISFRECVKKQPAKIPVAARRPSGPKPAPKKIVQTAKKPEQTTATIKRQTGAVTKDTLVIRRKLPDFPPPPPVLTRRTNATVKQLETEAGEIRLDLYDNGEIDGDTVSIYHNNTLVVAHARLTQKPITLRIAINPSAPHHELVMVAENLGTIPPNTSLMIVTAGTKRYQVFISSTEQKNSKVVFDLKE